MQKIFGLLILLGLPGFLLAGHTRPGYVDGCQSMDGRYVVTAQSAGDPKATDNWKFTWKDTKTGETHTGKLVGLPYGLEHFTVTYTHIFVPPGGETFAVFQTAAWAQGGSKPPKPESGLIKNPGKEILDYPGFADRIVIYKKTGEIVKRIGMKDILRPHEWIYVNWVQGNLYWLTDVNESKNGEAPRCGYRYYRISPDYSVLEFVVGPNADAKHKVKDEGPDVVNYRRTVRVSLTDGTFLDPGEKIVDPNRIPVKPFLGDWAKRGDQMKNYIPSLDPVRVPGRVNLPSMESK